MGVKFSQKSPEMRKIIFSEGKIRDEHETRVDHNCGRSRQVKHYANKKNNLRKTCKIL